MIDCVIIGGGLAGSYLATELSKKKIDFLLLEASWRTGGRHLTIDDRYEAGAWRVHSSHKRMKKLCEDLGLNLDFFEKQRKNDENLGGIKGLSKLDEIIIKNDGDISASLREEMATGYQGTYDSASTTSPYGVNTENGEYYTVREGQEEIICKLLEKVEKRRIKLNHRVNDIKREKNGYTLTILYKNSKGKVAEKTLSCKYLFSCIAQFDAWNWSITQEYLYPLMNSVKPHPLMHIYAKGKPPKDIEKKRKIPDSALQQIIPSTHDNDWYQISYSAGRVAMFWYNYKMRYGTKKMKELLEHYGDVKIEKVESYFWSHAYHLWLTTPYFDLEKAVKNSIMPSPVMLPNFWWAGECFSSYQGWSEGALETSDMVLRDFFDQRTGYCPIYKSVPSRVKEYMILDGRILDVKKWKNVHPGSKEAIVGHLGEDISKLFRYIKHSELSWATLYSLQIGHLR